VKRLFYILLLTPAVLLSCEREEIPEEVEEAYVTPPEYLFDDTVLPALSIAISEEEWNRLLDLYDAEPHNHDYVRCISARLSRRDASFLVTDAGIRLRGQTSRRRPEGNYGQHHQTEKTDWHHVHFGLHFRKFSETGEMAGVRRINLKYAKEDPTYIREHYCMDLLDLYGIWTAPKTSWCRLSIQVGESPAAYYGVYLMMESIDRQYVKNRSQFGPERGYLWKCGWGANLRDTDAWRFHQDDNSPETYAYDLKEADPDSFEPAKAQLVDFITKLNTLTGSAFYNWIQEVCDVDLLLKMYAANVALGHWDDYWNDMNNFYLYFNSRDPEKYQVYLLPYDYDNTLGTSHKCGVQTDSGRHDPYHWGLEECVLLYKILEVSDFRNKYTSYLRDFASVDNPWTGKVQSAIRIKKWQSLIGPYLKNDTGEDQILRDTPASWGNHPEYRILEDGPNNWFRVKAESINAWI